MRSHSYIRREHNTVCPTHIRNGRIMRITVKHTVPPQATITEKVLTSPSKICGLGGHPNLTTKTVVSPSVSANLCEGTILVERGVAPQSSVPNHLDQLVIDSQPSSFRSPGCQPQNSEAQSTMCRYNKSRYLHTQG